MKKRIVITAGPTREHIDPVRFLSNPSTGKMGFSLALAAAKAGFETTLIAGPVALPTPLGVRRLDVVSARDMLREVEKEIFKNSDAVIFVSTAAVADWRPKVCARKKLRKNEMNNVITLTRNPDILKTISSRAKKEKRENLILVGFAAETHDVLQHAKEKCAKKNLSLIVANDVTEKGAGFASDTNRVSLIFRDGKIEHWKKLSKRAVATRLVKILAKIK